MVAAHPVRKAVASETSNDAPHPTVKPADAIKRSKNPTCPRHHSEQLRQWKPHRPVCAGEIRGFF
jgi:hypothetical protein